MAGDAHILVKRTVAARSANPCNSDHAEQSQSQASRETPYGVTTSGINGAKQSQLLEDGQQGVGGRHQEDGLCETKPIAGEAEWC